jgi:heptose I phosphotransferase
MKFWLSAVFKSASAVACDFDAIMALDGQRFRELDNRRTFRFLRGDQAFFAKLHFGVGWAEIIKNLVQGRLPIVSAYNEYAAIQHLNRIGVATMTLAGFGVRGANPATRQSFVLTHELADMVSLEDLAKQWAVETPTLRTKRAVLRALARAAGAVHRSGMNHRDFYLCHFLMPNADRNSRSPSLHLIDLHRAQIRHQVPRRWLEKDLAGLYFSALDAGLTHRDCLRFVRVYSQQPLRQAELGVWRRVEQKALALYQRDHRRPSPFRYFQ